MNDDYCLWMGNITPEMNESIIENIFRFYSVFPLTIKLIKDKKTNKNKDYCFIYFKNIFEANNTLNKLNGKSITNIPFTFKLNWANFLNSINKTIYVGNLNPLVDDTSLFDFFKSKYKSVSKAKIISGHRQSKKYGFVTFKKEYDYRRSLIEMNGIVFEGTRIKVKEYKRKKEDENNNNNYQTNLNTNNQLDLKNEINYYTNNNEKLLNMNNNFLIISNSINGFNWINNANPINDVSIGINQNNNININSNKNMFNKNIFRDNFSTKNNNINFNNSLKCNNELFNLIDIDINNINILNNTYKNNNIIIYKNIANNNKTNKIKANNKLKLEIMEEFDEIKLKIKINESLNKMLEYYKENILINGSKIVCKLILYLIFV